MLKDKIQESLKDAMKNRDSETVDTLRLLLSDVKNAEIDAKQALSDTEIVGVIKKSVKKLREASEMFAKAARTDLVEQYTKQIEILSAYLPAELSDSELKSAVDDVIARHKDLYEKSPQAIIGIVMKELSNQADPQRIIALIKKEHK